MISKIAFFCLYMFSFYSGYSQKLSGTVVFKVVSASVYDDRENDERGKKMVEGRLASLAKQTFLLEFTASKSKFVRNNSLSINDDKGEQLYDKMTTSYYSSSYDYYLDSSAGVGMFKYSRDGTLITQQVKEKEWDISTESKKIGDYLCYKAVYIKKYMGRDGNMKTLPITAWFVPSLPYRYGPKQYYGLPGLILELHELFGVFLATDIKIGDDKNITIEFPKGKTISEEEYNARQAAFVIKSK
ncbi:GLPGLI family protein [Flavobacterium sp. CG_9.1]|uniref:GLPGLI family protein n=1 Tax=Flavobacterium sp. CG_9.1 TaxID=2787728 RepID=UPI0021054A6C|nr:GLPGLI family protein [Flavobacterium sp. CG_9.1]